MLYYCTLAYGSEMEIEDKQTNMDGGVFFGHESRIVLFYKSTLVKLT